jgi:nucleoside-diphosphate-sugar epimerase
LKVTVLGATGVLGRNVVPRLMEAGHQVVAVVRRRDQIPSLERAGVRAALGDILEGETLLVPTMGADAVLHLATSIPRRNEAQDWSKNDRIRREGTENLIAAAQANGVARYVQQSIALIYGDHGQELVDESAALRPNEITQSAADMEARVRSASLEWTILRGGLFYGPGTGREEGWRSAVREEGFRVPGDGQDMLSLVHIADMARAVVCALEEAGPGTIYNVVDDTPISNAEIFEFVASQEGVPDPEAGGPKGLPSLACSNHAIQQSLEWTPAYPSYRTGLVG